MNDQAELSGQHRTASPWPIFVALGIPIAELGILFDVFVVAVAGYLLFCGSVTGMLRETGYAKTTWGPLVVFAALLFLVGGILAFTDVNLVSRGYAALTAGAFLAAVGIGSELLIPDRDVI